MKTTTTKMSFTFILLLVGMLSYTIVNAQSCPANKVWTCRYDSCGVQECKCVKASEVQSWSAVIPPCTYFHFHPHCCDGWRNGQMEIKASLQVNPNPVLNSTVISFSLEQSQKVSIRIFDMSGRLVTTLVDAPYEEGNQEIVWNASDVNSGIYFVQFQMEENSQMIKLAVTK
jgi:hypothetical protein